jgi:hypothetical protein
MLSRFIDSEVVETANIDWRGMLAGIGIVKGQPFQPDEHAKAILDSAAKTAFKMSRVPNWCIARGSVPACHADRKR